MMSPLGHLLRALGPVAGGSSPPATPVLSITDNRDGTGATATIAGSDPGTTERVYYGKPGSLGATYASRSGNGAVPLSLTDGVYAAYVVSLNGSLPSLPSPETTFSVTGGAVAASSALALSKAKLRAALSLSATFQAARGVGNAADALESIYLAAKFAKDEREFASLRPFAVVGTHAELGYDRDSGGTKNYLVASGAVYFYLTANDADPTNPGDASIEWDNLLGGVMEDLEALAGLDDNLSIRQMAIEGYGHSDEDGNRAQQPFWFALVRVEWGP